MAQFGCYPSTYCTWMGNGHDTILVLSQHLLDMNRNWSWHNLGAIPTFTRHEQELVMAQFGCYHIFQERIGNWSWHNLDAIPAFSRRGLGTGHGTIWVLSQHLLDMNGNCSWHNFGTIPAYSWIQMGTNHGMTWMLSQQCPGITSKNQTIWVKTASVPAQIQTRNLPNTSLEHQHCPNLCYLPVSNYYYFCVNSIFVFSVYSND
jgi:hypothetical protein